MNPYQSKLAWVLVGLFTLVWFGSLDYRHLVKPDEGRYAEISREMANSGDWITPRLNGIKYFEKPPLQYWLTALAFNAFGANEWTARLWTALCGYLGIVIVGIGAKRLHGVKVGWLSVLFLATNFFYVGLGHINTLDMGLTFFLTLSLVAFLVAQHAPQSSRAEISWMLVAWSAVAGAVLSKGLIGVVIPSATLVIYSLAQRDGSAWRRLHPLPGLLVFLAISAPWFVTVSLRNPEFPYFFFIHEHFLRYATHLHRRDEPWWFFIPILCIGLIPWTIATVAGFVYELKAQTNLGQFSAQRFLLVWCGFVMLFFSLSGSKLPAYILPIFPALALLLGPYLSQISTKVLLWNAAAGLVLGLVGLIALPLVLHAREDWAEFALYRNYSQWLAVAMAVLAMGGGFGLYLSKQRRLMAALTLLGISGFVAIMLGLLGHESLAPSNSSYYIAQELKPMLRVDIPLYSIKIYDQTLPFYLNRTVTLVAYVDEFEYGLKQEPEKSIPTLAEFETVWRSGQPALAVMAPEQYLAFIAQQLPMRFITQDSRRVIIATQ
ncbi:MAG: phospholipid carrier-dependent glycosyltransferase [Burkholderiales bacterium]